MSKRRGSFGLNEPWYADWVLLTAVLVGVIVGASRFVTHPPGPGINAQLAVADLLVPRV